MRRSTLATGTAVIISVLILPVGVPLFLLRCAWSWSENAHRAFSRWVG